jgi:hypothetical protein
MNNWIQDAISLTDQVPADWLLEHPRERENIERQLRLRLAAATARMTEPLGPVSLTWRQEMVEGREYDTISVCEIRQPYRRKVTA